ncbi:hypothetical protein G4B88_013358 [Cannabis sativa]|uniref:Polygalacturonase n=1 Tax=Cannabis sativa TaxID=3483 RepID=A0A7J6E2B4_CANSA|nr:hypothetical protein G4B88_013358 [Cannabis sativa]
MAKQIRQKHSQRHGHGHAQQGPTPSHSTFPGVLSSLRAWCSVGPAGVESCSRSMALSWLLPTTGTWAPLAIGSCSARSTGCQSTAVALLMPEDMLSGLAADLPTLNVHQEQGNIVVNGITSLNSQTIHISMDHCKNVVIRKVYIRAPSSSPNTDGILLQASTGITVSRSTIMTGDDCVAIKSGCSNVWIEGSNCGPGHGISIGSLGDSSNESGVQNVTVTSCTFTKTQNGVRIKTWAKPSNGYATNIHFRNLVMNNVDNPIIIDQGYCPGGGGGCPRHSSGVRITKVTYSNIKGTSATKVAVRLACSPTNPCYGIKLVNVKLLYLKKSPASLCAYARGSSSGVVIPRIGGSNITNKNKVVVNVVGYGAKGDGKTDSSKGFVKAWSAVCGSKKAATMYIPKGRYLLNPIVFRGPCRNRVTLHIDGTLLAPSNYWAMGNSGYWILFIKINRLSVLGGTIDAKGAAFWACRKSGNKCPVGARSMTFNWVNNGVISGLTSINSQQTHLVINSCTNVLVKNVRLRAPDQSPNTDGIHVQGSTGVTITGATLRTGDDCISIGPATKNLHMTNINCGPGHGVSIGSLGKDQNEGGVQNVTLTNAVFTGSDNGVRIKSWARPTNGFVTNIVFQNLIMNGVKNPIIIDQNYCPSNKGCPRQSSGVKITQVTYKNIRGTSATKEAVKFDCSGSNPCRGIRLHNINLTYRVNKNVIASAISSCKNIAGTTTGVLIPRPCIPR